MNVALSGSRTFTDRHFVEKVAARLLENDHHLIIGDAPNGVDDFLFKYLHREVHWAHWSREIAQWKTYGRAAGHERNGRMINRADMLVAIFAPGPRTPGTSDAYEQAASREIPIWTYHEGTWVFLEGRRPDTSDMPPPPQRNTALAHGRRV